MSHRLVCLSQCVKDAPSRGGRIFVSKDDLARENLSLFETPGILECLILSTCLRFEIYAVAEDAGAPAAYLRRSHGVGPDDAAAGIAVLEGADAVRHLFSVVCGLRSNIVGEKQIVAQVKEAYRTALAAGCTGPVLNRLFQRGLNVSRRVRTKTGIDTGVCSAASLAVRLLLDTYGDLSARRVLILGAGQVGKLAGLHLAAKGCRAISFAARSTENARIVAGQCAAGVIPFDRLAGALRETDILITATGAPHEVVGYRTVADAAAARGGRGLCIIDLADPPDVDRRVSSLPGVTLFTIRCVDALATETRRTRAEAARAARSMIEEAVGEFRPRAGGAARPAACVN
ncbi:MAG: glutamyl-tRNA reductase [bacterium]|nr:glutamyl-tRNA reductase [bacterium]